jgi:hypothetical protein
MKLNVEPEFRFDCSISLWGFPGIFGGTYRLARKNRSDEAMETLLTPLLKIIAAETNCTITFQREFSSVIRKANSSGTCE